MLCFRFKCFNTKVKSARSMVKHRNTVPYESISVNLNQTVVWCGTDSFRAAGRGGGNYAKDG